MWNWKQCKTNNKRNYALKTNFNDSVQISHFLFSGVNVVQCYPWDHPPHCCSKRCQQAWNTSTDASFSFRTLCHCCWHHLLFVFMIKLNYVFEQPIFFINWLQLIFYSLVQSSSDSELTATRSLTRNELLLDLLNGCFATLCFCHATCKYVFLIIVSSPELAPISFTILWPWVGQSLSVLFFFSAILQGILSQKQCSQRLLLTIPVFVVDVTNQSRDCMSLPFGAQKSIIFWMDSARLSFVAKTWVHVISNGWYHK